MRKIATVSLSTLLVLIAFASAFLFWALATEHGFRTTMRATQSMLPALQTSRLSGTWFKGVKAEAICWQASDFQFCMEQADLRVRLSPLLRSRIELDYLHAGSLQVDLLSPGNSAPGQGLPEVFMPYFLGIGDIAIKNTLIKRGETTLFESPLMGQASWFGHGINVSRIELKIANTAISCEGGLSLTGDYRLALAGLASAEQLPGDISWRAAGSLASLDLQASLPDPAVRLVARLQVLENNVPFDASLRLDAPLLLPVGEQVASVDSLELSMAGDFAQQHGRLESVFSEELLGSAGLSAVFNLDWPRLAIEPVVTNPNAKVEAICDANLSGLSWGCRGEFMDVVLDRWITPGTVVRGQFVGSGVQRDTFHSLSLAAPAFEGVLAGESIAGSGEIMSLPGGQWQIKKLRLSAAQNTLVVEGRAGHGLDLDAELDMGDLSRLPLGIAGALRGSLGLSGKPGGMLAVDANLQGEKLQWRNLSAGRLKLVANIPEVSESSSLDLRLFLHEIEVPGLASSALSLQAAGTVQSHTLQLAIESGSEGSKLEASCEGRLDSAGWATHCAPFEGQLAHAYRETPARINLGQGLAMQYANAEFVVAPLAIEIDSVALELTEALRVAGTQASGRMQWRHLPFRWLAHFYPQVPIRQDNDTVEGYLELGGLQPLVASSVIESDRLLLEWANEDQQQQLLLTGLRAQADLSADRLTLTAACESAHDSSLQLQVAVDEPGDSRVLSGKMRIDVGQTSEIASFFNATQFGEGKGFVDIDLGGTTSEPLLNGKAELGIADIAIEELENRVDDLRLQAAFSANEFTYNGYLQAGTGRVLVDGSGNWQELDNYQLKTSLAISKLALMFEDRGSVLFDSNLEFQMQSQALSLTGDVDVLEADIQLEHLSPKVIRISPDTVITGRPEGRSLSRARDIELAINLEDQARFRGYGADFRLSGQLALNESEGRSLEAYGKVDISTGRYRAYGQRLNVRRGKLLFNGPLDNPVIDFEAIRDTPGDQVAGIALSGTLQKPVSRLFAEPPMPESDVAYFLVTGKHRNEGSVEDATLDTALFALANTGIGTGASNLASRLGVEDFQFSASKTEGTTTANVSGYVTPRLYVRFGTSIGENINTLFLQYMLTRNLVLESVSGLNNSMDIFYFFKID